MEWLLTFLLINSWNVMVPKFSYFGPDHSLCRIILAVVKVIAVSEFNGIGYPGVSLSVLNVHHCLSVEII